MDVWFARRRGKAAGRCRDERSHAVGGSAAHGRRGRNAVAVGAGDAGRPGGRGSPGCELAPRLAGVRTARRCRAGTGRATRRLAPRVRDPTTTALRLGRRPRAVAGDAARSGLADAALRPPRSTVRQRPASRQAAGVGDAVRARATAPRADAAQRVLAGKLASPVSGAPHALAGDAKLCWTTVYRRLSGEFGWTPSEIGRLTLPQLQAYLTGAGPRKVARRVRVGAADARALADEARGRRDGWIARMMDASTANRSLRDGA